MNTIRKAMLLAVFLAPAATAAGAAEADLRPENLPAEQAVSVYNRHAADTPTIYAVGVTALEDGAPVFTRGLTLEGTRLTETMLTGSVLILYPGGGGRWGYNTGFELFRGPYFDEAGEVVPARERMEYARVRHDPLDRVSVSGGDMNLLLLYNRRPLTPLRYRVAFPEPMRVRTFTVSSNCDQLRAEGVAVTLTLYADEERAEVLARRTIGGGEGRFPVTFEGLDAGGFIFEMSAAAPEDYTGIIGFYQTRLEAEIDTGDLALPVLEPGENTFRVSADEGSAPRARLVMRWLEDKPGAGMFLEDFEDPETAGSWRAGAGGEVAFTAGSFEEGFAFSGGAFGRLTFPAEGNHTFSRRFPEPVDLGGAGRLAVAGRVIRGAPMYTVLLRFHDAGAGWQPWLRGMSFGGRWRQNTFDISGLERSRVTALEIYFSVSPGFTRPGEPCVYDIDGIGFLPAAAAPPARALPGHVAGYRSPHEGAGPVEREVPPLQEWFPMGVYDGILGRDEREATWLLDRMKALNMNTVYVSNGSLDGLERLLPAAEARGIRLVYQGGGPGALYYLGRTPEQRRRYLEGTILPAAEARVPGFAGRWGIAAWSLTEEIPPDWPRELAPYYELMRRLAPDQPPTVLHNSLEAARADLALNRPLVITYDFYPFFWNPQSGPSTPARSLSMFTGRIAGYYRACREHGASLWMMPQAWGGYRENLDPPAYGDETGMRRPEPGEIKQQGWLAVAEGATGVMYYAAVPREPGTSHLWEHGFLESDNTRAAGALFAALKRVAPLLVRLERDYREEGFVAVAAGRVNARSFVKREGYPGGARYLVVASRDGFEAQEVALEIPGGGRVFDMVARREVTGELGRLALGAGEGLVLLVGADADYRADLEMIEQQLDRYYRD